MKRTAPWCLLLVLLPAALGAQGAPDARAVPRPNTVTAFASLGYVHNLSSFDVTPQGLDRNGVSGAVRVMWQPGYLLSAGIEVGHTHVYSITRTVPAGTYHQTLAAWPILFVFSMAPTQRLHINVGTGPSLNTGSATLAGSSASSSALGATYMASALYLAPLSPAFSLGAELRYLRLAKYEDNNLSLQITLARTWRKP